MIDHIGIVVSDFQKSKRFYTAVLSSIGLQMLFEVSVFETDRTDIAGYGTPSTGTELLINRGLPNHPGVHVAFRVASREMVDEFYKAAIAAGGRDNGSPGLRPHHPNYYGAFVLDFDGHNIEAVCHEPPA